MISRAAITVALLVTSSCGKNDSPGTSTAPGAATAPDVEGATGAATGDPAVPGPPPDEHAAPEAACTPTTDGSIDCAESARTTPFSCVRFNDDCSIDVQLEPGGEFARLQAVAGIPVETLVDVAKRGCDDGERNWKKRIAEDLSAVIAGACGTAAPTVEVSVSGEDGAVTTSEREMSEDRRRAVKDCWEELDACS